MAVHNLRTSNPQLIDLFNNLKHRLFKDWKKNFKSKDLILAINQAINPN